MTWQDTIREMLKGNIISANQKSELIEYVYSLIAIAKENSYYEGFTQSKVDYLELK